MDYRPRLRAHVELAHHEGDSMLLDKVLGRRIDLEPSGVALVGRLDGRPLAEALTVPGDEVLLRRLLLLNLVEGAGDRVVERIARVRAGTEDVGISLLDGTRFQCQGSGECCQNYVFGPLDDADVARLDALDLKSGFPHIEPPYVENTVREDGYNFRYLKSVDDRCVFLEDDRRCGLHRRYGADSKPHICRLYPYETNLAYDGLRIYDKSTCATFAASSRAGLPLVDDLERVRALIPNEYDDIKHPIVHVDEHPCDFYHYDRFAKTSIQLLRQNIGTAPETLRAISRGLRGFAHILRTFPLESGQPDAAISELLEGDLERWYDKPPAADEVQQGAYRLSQMFSALLLSVSGAIGESARTAGYLSQRLLREAAQLFHTAGALAFHVAEPENALDPYFEQLRKTPVAGPDIDEVLRISIRQQLFSLDTLVDNHALAGILRAAITQVLAVTGARVRAVTENRSEAVATDLSWGHMLAARVLRRNHAAPLLIASQPHFTAILEALPALVA